MHTVFLNKNVWKRVLRQPDRECSLHQCLKYISKFPLKPLTCSFMRTLCCHVMPKALWIRNTRIMNSFSGEASDVQCSKFIKWSIALRYFLKPHCWSFNTFFDNKKKEDIFTIRFMIFWKHCVKAIRLNELGYVRRQELFSNGMTRAKCHEFGNVRVY